MNGAVIYLSDQTHASVDRAIKVLGFRPDQLQRVPVDSSYRISVEALTNQIERDAQAGRRPFCVIANAGTTNTGAIDPLPELADVCQSRSLWLHVDAAYGGFAVLTERGRQWLEGLNRADSITLDPHKWLYQPYEAGCVLVKDVSWLKQTFQYLPEYMQDAAPERGKVNFCDYGLQLTRQFRALKVWMSLKKYGVRAFRQAIDQSLDLTLLAEALLDRSPVCEILSRAHLGIVCFRYVPRGFQPATEADEEHLNRLNEKLVELILHDGRAMLTSTRLNSRFAIRFCILNHRTRKEDVEETVMLIERLGKEAEKTTQHG
jgi:glutamate/tyrosine decarboxylase-like PLP-dependent enzyme